MNGWLLDTNIISELRKPNCHPAVQQWAERQPPRSFYLSTVTLAEIRFGIERVNDTAFRQELTQWLEGTLRPWFSDRILAVDEDVILTWRQMVEKGRKQGYTYSQPDLFIAATAALHNLCVVTRNLTDFQKSEIATFNPFTDFQEKVIHEQ
jgi:toxin FitB